MKGLLLKDYYTLLKQLRYYLIFIVIFALIPSMNFSNIAMVYAAMLPITVIAYDERSKWDQLAIMMPYSKRELVFSKYLIGYIGVALCMALSFGLQAIISAFGGAPLAQESVLSIIITAFVALLLMAINLPFMFWLGVERGRIIFLILIAVTVFLSMMSLQTTPKLLQLNTITPTVLIAISAVAALVANVASVRISNRLYQKKMS